MASDASLNKYESSEDVVGPKCTFERVGEEVIAHVAWSPKFTIDGTIADVWKYMRDFNLWMEDFHYNCIVGNATDGESIFFVIEKGAHEYYRKEYGFDPTGFKKSLIVRRNIPGKLIVLEELSPDSRKLIAYYLWALNEHLGKTTVSGVMSYAPHWESNVMEEKLRVNYQNMAHNVAERWKTAYIPRLRQWVESGH